MANNKCKECGCSCRRCVSSDHDHDVHLHVEIENLKQKLVERESHIVMMETNFLNEANKFPSGEMVAIREELLTWQDKYRRLYDAHRRIQRVNQGLEDKLLKLVDSCETDKTALTRDVAVLSQKLAEANYVVKKLSEDNERYKKDVSLAIQFLQCKQTNFVAHKFDSLPEEVQAQVSSFVSTGCGKRKPDVVEKKVVYEMKSIKVPIPTFPPTAMVYSIPKSPKLDRHHQRHQQQQQQMTVVRPNDDIESADPNNHQVDIVSAAIMAKVLEERQKERAYTKHCDTCTCSQKLRLIHNTATHHSASTQTDDDVDFVGFGAEPPGSGGGGFQSFNLPATTTTMAQNQNSSSSTGAMRIVRNSELKTNSSSSNVHNQSSLRSGCLDDAHNVAKVQPNNFLAIVDEDGSKGEDEEEEPLLRPNDGNNTSAANVVGSVESPENNTNMSSPKDEDRQGYGHHHHHYLCSEVAAASQSCTDLGESTTSGDETSAKNGSSDRDLKGPRYCSVRVQSGTRNILLDNVHNSTAPVLYTRHHHKLRTEDTPTTHECPHHLPDSTITTTTTNSSSRDPPSRRNSNNNQSDSPAQHKQRVADWLRNNPDNNNEGGGVSSSDNSRSDPTAPIEGHVGGVANVTVTSSASSASVDASRLKYAEMEENVKRFLFGESEFLKTVEIGKLRYKAYRAGGKGKGGNREGFSEVGAMQEQAKATI